MHVLFVLHSLCRDTANSLANNEISPYKLEFTRAWSQSTFLSIVGPTTMVGMCSKGAWEFEAKSGGSIADDL